MPRQFFTNGFMEEAVKLVVKSGLTLADAGRRLSLSPQTSENWITKHKAGKLNLSGRRCVSGPEAEISKLCKEFAEARLKMEIIKKAIVYRAFLQQTEKACKAWQYFTGRV